jgi:hypothetical protein
MLGLALISVALAGGGVQPATGDYVEGRAAFPRPQHMSISVENGDRLAVRLGFDGRCTGGGLGELWIADVPGHGTLRVHGGAFSGRVTGTDAGIVRGRVTSFAWTLSGRFTGDHVATAVLEGRATVRSHGRVISRCRIARPARARLLART